MSVNKVILLGYVGRDPEIRFPQPGFQLAMLTLATNETVGNPPAEITEWHNLVMTGKNAELAEKYIRKGTRMLVEGKLRTRFWEDRNAIKHTITEILVNYFDIIR